MAKNEVKIVVVSEKRHRELYRAQILMEILQGYRNAHDDYDFGNFALEVFPKGTPVRESAGNPDTEA